MNMKASWETDLPTLSEEDGIRYLHFDSPWVQGAMRMSHPVELVLEYTRQMMSWLMFRQPGPQDHIGIMGLGAGSLLRFTLHHTRARVDTVERNEQVVAACRAFFRLPGTARSSIDLADARDWAAEPGRAGRYMALMVDLYDAQAQGPVCSELSFYQDCYRILDGDGIMVVNLFGHHDSFGINMQAISSAFDGRVLCLPELDEGNVVALAFRGQVPDLYCPQWLDHVQALESRMGLRTMRWARALQAQPRCQTQVKCEPFRA